MIIARPNQSATWTENLWLVLLLAIPMLVIAVAFALLGAWLILPFAGLELLALGVALHRVCWKLQYRHVITVSADSVYVDKGYHCPLQRWRFARASAGLAITSERHPCDRPSLRMHDRDDSVVLGDFLNREDSLQLIALLQQEIRVRSHGDSAMREF